MNNISNYYLTIFISSRIYEFVCVNVFVAVYTINSVTSIVTHSRIKDIVSADGVR